jgi:FlaA1/EpsC-like NDP-sugar epimerase
VPFLHFEGFPRSILVIDGILSFMLIALLRIAKRMYLEIYRGKSPVIRGKRTIVIGAGNKGEMMVRDMVKDGFHEYYPVGILDDEKKYTGMYVHGVRVLGKIDDLQLNIHKSAAEVIIIANPSLDYKILREIYRTAHESNIDKIKVVPRIYVSKQPDINLKSLEDLPTEDLIGRQPVKVDYEEIEQFLENKVIMITGAGGSIGSEITMQVSGFLPHKIILVDNDETSLYDMQIKLDRVFPHLKVKTYFITADIRDKCRIDSVFRTYKPEIVFHAAAYKHVPMMELNPTEAVHVNMFGTYNLATTSVEYGVEKFIQISTDKAVRPTSIMGATKRVAEQICGAMSSSEKTEFISVRFGNVLGSRGSVLPTFLDQLRSGGPLTVTHKDMMRYFMTISEAVSLVLQASVIGKRDEVLVLDMGEQVKIVDLAEELIRIHGLVPYNEIDIKFTGKRPGEKLFEELLTKEEGTIATRHDKVYIAKQSEKYARENVEMILKEFDVVIKDAEIGDEIELKKLLKKYVAHFIPESNYELS